MVSVDWLHFCGRAHYYAVSYTHLDVYKRQLSNRFGRRNVLSAAFLLQMLLMFGAFFLSQSGSAVWIVLAATFIGMSYGANLVLFPNYVKDFWGMRHFGAIYGMLFTAWGVGGFVMIKVAENLTVNSGSSFQSFMVAGCLMPVSYTHLDVYKRQV